MPSLQSKTDPALERAAAIGQDLAGVPVLGVMQITGGGNNGVFRLDGAHETYALKLYRRDADDPRDRLAAEVAAHAFFARYGVGQVAEMITSDAQAGAALFPWIEGKKSRRPTRPIWMRRWSLSERSKASPGNSVPAPFPWRRKPAFRWRKSRPRSAAATQG